MDINQPPQGRRNGGNLVMTQVRLSGYHERHEISVKLSRSSGEMVRSGEKIWRRTFVVYTIFIPISWLAKGFRAL